MDLKDTYNNILRISRIIGVNYRDLKTLTIQEFNAIGEGYLQKYEDDINMQLKISHQLAALIGVAINAPREFPKESAKIELDNPNLTEKEKEELRLERLKEVACRMWGNKAG